MLDSIQSILLSVWNQDVAALLSPDSMILIYILAASVIALEGAFLPAVPLPNDSVVILIGTLTALGGLEWQFALPLLIAAASLGSWLAFIQGRLLTRLPKIQSWVSKVPDKKLAMVDLLLFKHSFIALFFARFFPIVRILVPMTMGGRGQNLMIFQVYSLLSASLWATLLFGVGFLLPYLPENVSRTVTSSLLVLSIVTFFAVIFSGVILNIRMRVRVISNHLEDLKGRD